MAPLRMFFILSFLQICLQGKTQDCDCTKDFLHIQHLIEENYAGFKDKVPPASRKEYDKFVAQMLKEAGGKHSEEKCLLIISHYLDNFKDDHIQVRSNFNPSKIDSDYIARREKIQLSDRQIASLSNSKRGEGVFVFRFDSSYRIAVMKEKTILHDYVGVIIDSKLPTWKRGMIKFEAKLINDSLAKGILFMRNHMPKVEWFYLDKNSIGGDWQREGTVAEKLSYNYIPVASKMLSDQTLYIKISNFDPSNAKRIDSVFKSYSKTLESTPNLILDLRDNGGGADFAFSPILPYLYSNPIKTVGVDVLSTEANIAGWKKLLDDEDIPENSKNSIRGIIQSMENHRGRLVSINEDGIDSSFKPAGFPKKVAILINKGCASTTEQLLLVAKQSSKVILLGENTSGTLDYSNMREANFSCMPYILAYATTRSRRLDIGEGIDDKGIQPDHYLPPNVDWIQKAMELLEK